MQRTALIVVVAAALSLSVAAALFDRLPGDLALAQAVQELQPSPWDAVMESVSFLGGGLPAFFLVLALALVFLLARLRLEGLLLFGALTASGLNYLVKLLIARPRPPDDLLIVAHQSGSPGFPSGHAVYATVLFGLLLYLAPTLLPWRWAVLALRAFSVLAVLLTGLSRIYLGAHWPSDVLGGLLFGVLYLALIIALYRRYRPHTAS